MSSIIKVGKVQSATGQDAIEIANDGHIQNALTFDGGIANAGTISAGTFNGTVGLTATNTVGWQHIKSFHHTSSSSATNEILFDNVFSSAYMAYRLHIGWISGHDAEFDLYFRLRSGGASGADHADALYQGLIVEYSQAEDDDYKSTMSSNNTYLTLINNGLQGDAYGATCFIDVYSVVAPTVLGTSTVRTDGAVYRPKMTSEMLHYHDSGSNLDSGYGGTKTYYQFNASHANTDYTGFKIWIRNTGDSGDVNVRAGTHMSLFGLKIQATA